MDSMESKILEVLQDPQQMEQIFEIAKGLGFGSPGEEQPQDSPMPDPAAIMGLLQRSHEAEPRQEALIQALLPYLKPERQRKLQRAMKLARLSNLAGFALQNLAE